MAVRGRETLAQQSKQGHSRHQRLGVCLRDRGFLSEYHRGR